MLLGFHAHCPELEKAPPQPSSIETAEEARAESSEGDEPSALEPGSEANEEQSQTEPVELQGGPFPEGEAEVPQQPLFTGKDASTEWKTAETKLPVGPGAALRPWGAFSAIDTSGSSPDSAYIPLSEDSSLMEEEVRRIAPGCFHLQDLLHSPLSSPEKLQLLEDVLAEASASLEAASPEAAMEVLGRMIQPGVLEEAVETKDLSALVQGLSALVQRLRGAAEKRRTSAWETFEEALQIFTYMRHDDEAAFGFSEAAAARASECKFRYTVWWPSWSRIW